MPKLLMHLQQPRPVPSLTINQFSNSSQTVCLANPTAMPDREQLSETLDMLPNVDKFNRDGARRITIQWIQWADIATAPTIRTSKRSISRCTISLHETNLSLIPECNLTSTSADSLALTTLISSILNHLHCCTLLATSICVCIRFPLSTNFLNAGMPHAW